MKRIPIFMTIVFIWISCSKPINKSEEKVSLANTDSLSLLDLQVKYSKTKDIVDLRIYLQRIDTILAKDSNLLTYDNIELLNLKLHTMTFNGGDSINTTLIDSLHQRILHFYKTMMFEHPNSPLVYIELGQMYDNNIDSAHFYYKKVLPLCDSILKEKPYTDNIYRLKVYALLLLKRKSEAIKMIKKDKYLMKNDKDVSKLLQEISDELEL